ncbi:MAG: hypothetical protein H6936_03645 [Burkholderiales bacterium]|nr:hypothetical protein [Burkholderiales bacterium]
MQVVISFKDEFCIISSSGWGRFRPKQAVNFLQKITYNMALESKIKNFQFGEMEAAIDKFIKITADAN